VTAAAADTPAVPASRVSASRVSASRSSLLRLIGGMRGNHMLRSSALSLAGLAVTSIAGLAYWAIAARRFGADSIGAAVAGVPVMSLVWAVLAAGVPSACILAYPLLGSARHRSFAQITAVSGAVTGLAATVVVIAAGSRLGDLGGNAAGITLMALGTASTAVAAVIDAWCLARRRAGLLFARNAVTTVVKLGLVVAVTLPAVGGLADGTVTVLVSWVAGFVVADVLVGVWLWRTEPRSPEAPRTSLWSKIPTNHVTNLATQAPIYAVPVVVAVRAGTDANAYFYAAWLLASTFALIATSVSAALLAEGAREPGLLARKLRHALAIVAALDVVGAVAMVALGRPLLGAFGGGYAEQAYPLLVVLILAGLPAAVITVAVNTLRVDGRVRTAAMFNSVTAVGAITLVAIGAGAGITGAGVGWLAANAVAAVPAVVVLHRAVRRGGTDSSGPTSGALDGIDRQAEEQGPRR
jgi:O-antigen/teichoic acid export membrane protein